MSVHLVDGEAKLVVGREEVRPEPQARVGPVVADDLARGELGVHGLEVGHAEDDRPAADRRLARRGELEAGRVDELDEQRRLAHRVGADPLDADLADDLVAGARGVVGGDVRRAGEEPRRAGRRLHLGLERERPRVTVPAGERGLELLGEVGPHVEPAGARPAAEPLDGAADAELDPERRHVERHRARRLVRVEADVRAGVAARARRCARSAGSRPSCRARARRARAACARRSPRSPRRRPRRRRPRRRTAPTPAARSEPRGRAPPRRRSGCAAASGRSTRGRSPPRRSRSGASRSSRQARR